MAPGTATPVVHIACSSDRAYVPHSAAMLHSVLSTRDGYQVHIHYLHGPDLPARDARRLTRMVEDAGAEISFLVVPDARVGGLRTTEFLPASNWYRVLLPELVPDLDRVLYLDVDLLVLGSLLPLWETDLAGHLFAAVTNVFQRDHLVAIDRLGLPGPEVYFNAGVMLMQLDEMRRCEMTRTVLEWATANDEKLRVPDQDALNVLFGDRRLRLHPRWNCMNSMLMFPWASEVFGAEALEEARSRPVIRHFEGPTINKPWHYLCEHEMRDLYFEHRRQTPWPRVRREGVTPRSVARRLLGRSPSA